MRNEIICKRIAVRALSTRMDRIEFISETFNERNEHVIRVKHNGFPYEINEKNGVLLSVSRVI